MLLNGLERPVLRSRTLQTFVLRCHRDAFKTVLKELSHPIRRVAIVGGGLFPRTALILRELFPDAKLVIIDSNAAHLSQARQFMAARGIETGIDFRQDHFKPGAHLDAADFDLAILPLAFMGNREAAYSGHSNVAWIVHDWIWCPRGNLSARVSLALLKRMNLVLPQSK